MASVVEVDDIEELESFRLVWNALWTRTPQASFFHSLDWLRAYWRHFGANQKLRVLLVHAAGEIIGIVPLTVVPERTRLGRLRVLTYPLHDWGTFFSPVGNNPTATMTLAMQHLRRTRRDWDLLDLRWIDKDDNDHSRTAWSLRSAGFRAVEGTWKQAALVDLRGDWPAYWSSRRPRMRANIQRCERRLAELGEVAYERYRPQGANCGDSDPRWDLFDECLDVARRSWQGQSVTGTTLSHTAVLPFFRETHALAARTGCLDVNVLRISGRAVAFAYNYHRNNRLVGMRIGYDNEFSQFSVGNVLYHRAFQDSCQRGDQYHDMGVGSIELKRPWLTRVVSSYHYTHYPLALRPQLLRAKHRWLASRGNSRFDARTKQPVTSA